MALEIKVHRFAEGLLADEGAHHPAKLGAFLIDRRGVEIVDLDIGLGPHRMGERSRILRELIGPQPFDIGDALYRPRADIGGELLVAEDGQALLETELEPIAAGYAVAWPVVEIFMGD